MGLKNLKKKILLILFGVAAIGSFQLSAQELWEHRDYKAMRLSSADPTGANDDGSWANKIESGETRVLGVLEGPGIIRHIWMTVASNEPYHLKKIVLRVYWDDEESPSIEAPLGDFFGLGLGKYHLFESRYLSVGSQRALNAAFPMPFRSSAKLAITNEGQDPINAFYFNVDWEKYSMLPEDAAYFHAQYRQQIPTDGWTTEWQANGDPHINNRRNETGDGNYLILSAEGKGHYVGVTHSILQNQGDWWGEGDEMIFIDGEPVARIKGTGAEDYYLGAWCYGGCGLDFFGNSKPVFDYLDYGNPVNGGDDRGAGWSLYRFHSTSPVPFEESIRVTIEHGHANHRSDNYSTVAYWYQTEPSTPFPALPNVEERIPRLLNIEGPTIGKH